MEVAALILWELRHSGNCDFPTPNYVKKIIQMLLKKAAFAFFCPG
ncbi:hypothetical protein LEP1GSC165_3755 [Leptospira santarosai str. CBC523]|nr:hypothetical protein LEP1GSC165_3755 [Leptospira santarosai str. CBC523]